MLPTLTTARLALRPATADDLGFMHRLLAEPAVRRYLCDDRVLPRETVAAIMADAAGKAADGLGLWIVERGGRPVGYVGLLPVAAATVAAAPALAGEVEPSIALTTAEWRRGYAGEALARIIRHAFEELGRPRLVATVDAPNDASHRMIARAGFVKTGEADGPCYRLRLYRLAAPT